MALFNRETLIAIAMLFSAANPVVSAMRTSAAPILISGPTTITANGYYLVSQDFAFASGTGIDIRASEVTVDLGGHTITNLGNGATIRSEDISLHGYDIRVTNGSIRGGGNGVDLTLFSLGGIAATEVDHLDIAGISGGGIVVIGYQDFGPPTDTTLIHNNTLSGGEGGITIFAVGGGQVMENVVQGCSATGIFVDGGNTYERVPEILHNIARGCSAGIGVSFTFGGIVEYNVARLNVNAFFLQDFSQGQFVHNEASDNSNDGLSTYDVQDNLLQANLISRNGGDGFDLDGPGVYSNLVYANILTGNAGCGINQNLGAYEYNVLAGNIFSDNGEDICP